MNTPVGVLILKDRLGQEVLKQVQDDEGISPDF